MKFVPPTFILLMLILAFPAYSQSLRKGVEAYGRGDFTTALREWQPLAEQGNAIAQAGLGLLYAEGQGVPRDYIEALKWIRLSVEQRNAVGQKNLADMYRKGHGVRQDYSLAVVFYQLAANQGYAPAQYSLGFMYENGVGIRRDYKQAYTWYTLAAERGHEAANRSRMILGELMPVGDRWEALERAQHPLREKTESSAAENSLVDRGAPRSVGATGQALPAAETPSSAPKVHWRVQLISHRSQKKAEEAWSRLLKANEDLLGELSLNIQAVDLPNGQYYRVQAGPLPDRTAAALLCSSLKSRNQDCLVIAP